MNANQIINITGGVLAYIFGAPDIWLIELVVLVITDYAAGLPVPQALVKVLDSIKDAKGKE